MGYGLWFWLMSFSLENSWRRRSALPPKIVCISCLHACMSARLVVWATFFLENSNLIRSVVNTLCWILWTALSGWHLHEKWVLWVNYRSHWSLKSIPVSGKTNELKTLRFCVTFVQAIIHVCARPGSRPESSFDMCSPSSQKRLRIVKWIWKKSLDFFCARSPSTLNRRRSWGSRKCFDVDARHVTLLHYRFQFSPSCVSSSLFFFLETHQCKWFECCFRCGSGTSFRVGESYLIYPTLCFIKSNLPQFVW